MPWTPTGWDPPSTAASAAGGQPNPAETSWKIGPYLTPWSGKLVVGYDLVLTGTLLNGGLPVAHADSDGLQAAIWRGQAEAPVATPVVSWISAAAGTLTLTLPAAATASLDPGLYRLQVGVLAGGVRSLAFDGSIELLEAPGTGTLRVPYVTGRDLLYWFDQLGTLQTIRGGDATFLAQRAEASDEFDRDLVVRYNPTRGFVRTRRATLDPILDTFDVPDPAAVPPTPAQLSAAIRAGGVIVDRNVREIVAKMAVAKILDRQEVMGGRNTYREQAADFRAQAMSLWANFDVQVDTSNPLDGVADLLIGQHVILLPPGTAP